MEEGLAAVRAMHRLHHGLGFREVIDPGEVLRGEKMTLREIDPESYITEYTLVYQDEVQGMFGVRRRQCHAPPGSRVRVQGGGVSGPYTAQLTGQGSGR